MYHKKKDWHISTNLDFFSTYNLYLILANLVFNKVFNERFKKGFNEKFKERRLYVPYYYTMGTYSK
mgnify:CR=1 FL=1|jgi:hypothetical protein